jgi:hypothetical protein
MRWLVVPNDHPDLGADWLGEDATVTLSDREVAVAVQKGASIHETYADADAAVKDNWESQWGDVRCWWWLRGVRFRSTSDPQTRNEHIGRLNERVVD